MILYTVLLSSFLVFLANGQTSPSYRCKVRKGREPNVKDSSCETFYACSEFAGQIRKCRGGQQFHFEALECKPDAEVWCNDQRSNVQTTTAAPTTAAPTTPAPTTAAATTAAATTAAATTAPPATTAAPEPAADDGIGALLAALFPQLNTIPGIGNLIPGLGGQKAVPNALDFGAQVPVAVAPGVAPGAVGGNVDPFGGGVAGPFGLRGVLPDTRDENGVDGGTIVITPDDGDGPIVIQAVVPNPNADALPPGQVAGAGNGVGPGSGLLGQGAGQDGGVGGGGGVGNDANGAQGQPGPFAGLPGGQGGVVNGGGVGNSFKVPQGQTFSNANVPQFPQNSPNNVNQAQGQVRPPITQGQTQPSFGQGPVIPDQTQSNSNSTIPRFAHGSFSPNQGPSQFSPNEGSGSPSNHGQGIFSPSQSPSPFSPNQGSGKIPTRGQNPLNPGLSDSDQKPPQHYAPAAFFPQVIIPAAATADGQAVTTLSSLNSQNLVNVGQRKLQSIPEEKEDAPDVDAGTGNEMVLSRFRRSLADDSHVRTDASQSQYNKDHQRVTADSSVILDGMSFVSNALSVANSVLSDILPKEDAQDGSSSNSDLDHQTVDEGSATSETRASDFLGLEKSFTQIGDAVLDAFSSVIHLLHNVDSGNAFHTSFSSPTPSTNPVDVFLNLGNEESSIVSHDSNNGDSQVLGEIKLQGQGGHNGDVLAHGQIAKISGNDTFNGDSPPHGYVGGESLSAQNDTDLENSTNSNGSGSGIVDLNVKQQNSVVSDNNGTVSICKNNTVSANGNKADSYTASMDNMNSTSLKRDNSMIQTVNNWLKIEIDGPVELEVDNDTSSDSTTHTHKEWSLTLTFGDTNSQGTSSSQNHIKVHSSSGTDDSDNGQGNSISNTFNHHFTFSNSHHSSSSSSSSNVIPSNGGSNVFHNTNSQPDQSFYPDMNSGQFHNPFNPFGDGGLGGVPVYPFGGGNGIQSQEAGNGNHGSMFSPFGGDQGINFQGPQGGTSSNIPGGAFPWGQMG